MAVAEVCHNLHQICRRPTGPTARIPVPPPSSTDVSTSAEPESARHAPVLPADSPAFPDPEPEYFDVSD